MVTIRSISSPWQKERDQKLGFRELWFWGLLENGGIDFFSFLEGTRDKAVGKCVEGKLQPFFIFFFHTGFQIHEIFHVSLMTAFYWMLGSELSLNRSFCGGFWFGHVPPPCWSRGVADCPVFLFWIKYIF